MNQGKAISKSSSAISTELEKAMNFIGQSLKAPPQSSVSSFVEDVSAQFIALWLSDIYGACIHVCVCVGS